MDYYHKLKIKYYIYQMKIYNQFFLIINEINGINGIIEVLNIKILFYIKK